MKKLITSLLFFGAVLAVSAQDDCNDNGACNFNATATGSSDCYYATPWYVDIDGDGIGVSGPHDVTACDAPSALYVNSLGDGCPTDPDKTAVGDCGCGVAETDSDGDGTKDCLDLCPFDSLKVAPGSCGCGFVDVDTDGDGTMDCLDECPDDILKTTPGTCGCGVSDATDSDSDGIADCVDICPGDPSQVDANNNGIGDACEVYGCTYSDACNFNVAANVYDGSCVFAREENCEVCLGNATDGTGTVSDVSLPGAACSCNGADTSYIDALGLCGGTCAEDVDDDGLCDDEDDCIGTLDACGVCNGPGIPVGNCDCFGNQLDECGECGGEGVVLGYDCDGNCVNDTDGDGICDEFEVGGCTDSAACNYVDLATDSLTCLYIDTCGVCGGGGIPIGTCDCDGTYPEQGKDCDGNCLNDSDSDGICDEFEVGGCTNTIACNYSPSATDDDGSCLLKDAAGECGGTCAADADGDGVCDTIDTCIGIENECGICGGDSLYFTNLAGLPCEPGTPDCLDASGNCDCMGNQLDSLGVCGGKCILDLDGDGICDLDTDGNVADVNVCDESLLDAVGECNGLCTTDADGDGLCDHDTNSDGIPEDPCLNSADNFVDECGVCGGSGRPEGDCDCNGNQLDDMGNCGGNCTSDADGDGICDDVDTCTGTLDECGVCNGPGIPAGDCDCFGNQEDAIGNCGGNCQQDSDNDGICDLDANGNILDTCDGTVDACGVCNGSGPLADCGCDASLAGECDCDGNVIDACGVCGGPGPEFGKDCDGNCLSDANGDGICDLLEEMKISDGVTVEIDDQGRASYILDPFKLQRTQDSLKRLLRSMTANLDDGSLTGHSENVTIEQSIVNNGTLQVDGRSIFNENVDITGFLEIEGDFNIDGNATIEGTTFSNGGTETSSIDMIGNADVQGNATIGKLLKVQGESTLHNALDLSGDFYIHQGNRPSGEMSDTTVFSIAAASGQMTMVGDFDVDEAVDIDGLGRLNGLNVDGLTRLDGTTLDSNLTLNSTLDVLGDFRMNGSAFKVVAASGNTHIDGDLRVAENMVVNGNIIIDSTATIIGTTFSKNGLETTTVSMSGDLDVEGKATIGMGMKVSGNTTFHQKLNGGGDFTIYNGTTGELLNTTETFKVASATGNTTIGGQLQANRVVGLGNWVQSGHADLNGSLAVDGGVELDGVTTNSKMSLNAATVSERFRANSNMTVLGDLLLNNNDVSVGSLTAAEHSTFKSTTITGSPSGTVGMLHVQASANLGTEFSNTSTLSAQNGIKITLNEEKPSKNNHYVQFLNSNDDVVGRIQGLKRSELNSVDDHTVKLREMNVGITDGNNGIRSSTMATVQAGFDMATAVVDLVAASTRTTTCFGIVFYWIIPVPFVCQTTPAPGVIASAIADVAIATVGLGTAIAGNVKANQALSTANSVRASYLNAMETRFRTISGEKIGVSYESGSGDYAEWLEKWDPEADYVPGQVVGVREGKISLNTDDADALFVISLKPIVLGNMPGEEEWKFERTAFMGQVPVMVYGKVRAGDYVVASGLNDGFAVAKPADQMTPSDMQHIVGRAWQDGHNARMNTVIVEIGPGIGVDEISSGLFSRVDQLQDKNDRLKDAIMAWTKGEQSGTAAAAEAGMMPSQVTLDAEDISWNTPEVEDITLFQFTPAATELAVERALQEVGKLDAFNTGEAPMLKMLREDPDYRESFISNMTYRLNRHNEWAAECQRRYENAPLEAVKKKYMEADLDELEDLKNNASKKNRKRTSFFQRFKKLN